MVKSYHHCLISPNMVSTIVRTTNKQTKSKITNLHSSLSTCSTTTKKKELKIQPTLNSLLIPLHIRNLNGRTSGGKSGTAASSQSSSSVSSSGNSATNTTSNTEPITSTQDLNQPTNESINREATPTTNA